MERSTPIYQLDGPTLSLGDYQSGNQLRDDSLITSILEKIDYTFERQQDLEKMRLLLAGFDYQPNT